LVTAILALAANLSITWSAAACLPATQDGFVSCHKDSPMGGALQDAFIGCLMAIFFGLGPLFALVGIDDSLIWLAYYLLYLGFLSLGATYLIHANLEFLVHRRSEGPLDPRVSVRTNDQAVRALTRHIRFQNVLCGVILFPLVIKQFLEDKDDRVEANMPGGIFESLKALMQD